MRKEVNLSPLLRAKIIWGALCASMIFYGVVLFLVERMTYFEVVMSPESFIEKLALASTLVLFVTFVIKSKLIDPQKDFQKRLPLYIACWALHEGMLCLGFVAVFLAENGNGFYYVVNLVMALIGNFILFPKQQS